MLFAVVPLAVPNVSRNMQPGMTAEAKILTKKQAKKKVIAYLKKRNIYYKSYQLIYESHEGNKYFFRYYKGGYAPNIRWFYVNKSTGRTGAM